MLRLLVLLDVVSYVTSLEVGRASSPALTEGSQCGLGVVQCGDMQDDQAHNGSWPCETSPPAEAPGAAGTLYVGPQEHIQTI